jgi:RimJ/RimL family protein N-acetyltransferase
MAPLFETKRLTLRGIEERDAEKLIELINDPDWIRYVGDRDVHRVEQAVPYIGERMLGRPGIEHEGLYVVERASDGAWLGNVSLFKRSYLDHPDVGFAFLPEGRGQGYAYESTVGLLEYLRDRLQTTRILGTTIRSNVSSIRLLEKLGMEFEREYLDASDRETMRIYGMDFPPV